MGLLGPGGGFCFFFHPAVPWRSLHALAVRLRSLSAARRFRPWPESTSTWPWAETLLVQGGRKGPGRHAAAGLPRPVRPFATARPRCWAHAMRKDEGRGRRTACLGPPLPYDDPTVADNSPYRPAPPGAGAARRQTPWPAGYRRPSATCPPGGWRRASAAGWPWLRPGPPSRLWLRTSTMPVSTPAAETCSTRWCVSRRRAGQGASRLPRARPGCGPATRTVVIAGGRSPAPPRPPVAPSETDAYGAGGAGAAARGAGDGARRGGKAMWRTRCWCAARI